VARILIVGGGCRGRRLAAAMVDDGHAVRVSTRTESGRTAIEATGAECWIGTPDRVATLRGSLENVTIACWLLGTATGPADAVRELHTSRLEFFLTQAIDTTVRGFVYETRGAGSSRAPLREGESVVHRLTERNAIPSAFLTCEPDDAEMWLIEARGAVASLLSRP
jgi:hypothetical protein